MPIVKGFFAGHVVFKNIPILARHISCEIRARHDGFNTVQRHGLCRVDFQDFRVGMRAADNRAMQHSCGIGVRAITCTTRDFVHPVGTIGPAPDLAEFGFLFVKGHQLASCNSSAATITARMILS